MTMSSVSVQVIPDNIAEGPEEFDLMLNVPVSLAPAIRAGGRNRAVGVITDSTSKCTYNKSYEVANCLVSSVGSGVYIWTVYWFRVIRIYRSYSEYNRRNIQCSYNCNSDSCCTVTSISYGYVMTIIVLVVYTD